MQAASGEVAVFRGHAASRPVSLQVVRQLSHPGQPQDMVSGIVPAAAHPSADEPVAILPISSWQLQPGVRSLANARNLSHLNMTGFAIVAREIVSSEYDYLQVHPTQTDINCLRRHMVNLAARPRPSPRPGLRYLDNRQELPCDLGHFKDHWLCRVLMITEFIWWRHHPQTLPFAQYRVYSAYYDHYGGRIQGMKPEGWATAREAMSWHFLRMQFL